jgi:hypothetical protein
MGDYDKEMFALFGGIGAVCASIGAIIVIPISIYNLLIIWLAPRAYLVEMVTGK